MSEQVKRYDISGFGGGMVESADGAWYHMADYDALHAEAEALRGLTPELPPRPPEGTGLPRYGLRWNGPGQPLAVPMDDGYWTPWHLAEAQRAENGRLIRGAKNDAIAYKAVIERQEQLRAERDSFQREGIRAMEELEAARADLRRLVIQLHAMEGRIEHSEECLAELAALTATPAPEVQAEQEESLDDRLKQAGMLSVAELLKGAPLDAFIKHAGVHDIATLLQWAEMRRGEYLRMMARYDLGEKDKGDDLYEWTVAHCAVFTELHVNLRAALAEQGERQEAVARVGMVPGTDFKSLDFFKTDLQELPVGTMLYTTPQPGPDVRELVEALKAADEYLSDNPFNEIGSGSILHRQMKDALAAHRQAQQGEQP